MKEDLYAKKEKYKELYKIARDKYLHAANNQFNYLILEYLYKQMADAEHAFNKASAEYSRSLKKKGH